MTEPAAGWEGVAQGDEECTIRASKRESEGGIYFVRTFILKEGWGTLKGSTVQLLNCFLSVFLRFFFSDNR